MERDPRESLVIFHGKGVDVVLIIARGVEKGNDSGHSITVFCVEEDPCEGEESVQIFWR